MTQSTTDPLFLGLDCSTQALKAVILDAHLQLISEVRVDFDRDLPHFGTTNGVHIGKDPEERGVVKAPVMMYVEALDLIMERMKDAKVEFSRIVSISGAAQQHAVLLSTSSYAQTCASNLDPSRPLAPQLPSVLASPFCSNWQDSSTTTDCHEMETYLAQAQAETHASNTRSQRDSGSFTSLPDPGAIMADLTGSSAHERFSGPQLRKLYRSEGKHGRDAWAKAERACLLSSFLTSLVCADGEVKGIDEADASGMNLYSLPSRSWDPTLLRSVVSSHPTSFDPSSEATKLQNMLGDVYTDPSKACGTVGDWFVQRYGFDRGCLVAPFTGDNPATLLSFSLQPGDAIVSLGTSDTVLLATETYNPNPDYHVFPHPAGDALDGTRRYMGMLCYKNGSLAREFVKDHIRTDPEAGSSKTTWEEFNSMVEDTPAPTMTAEDGGPFGFYFPKAEIIPRNVQGVFRFAAAESAADSESEMQAFTIEQAEQDFPPSDARRILESQFLSFKSRIKTLLPSGASIQRIFVTGGASANPVIVSLLASVLNGKVYSAGEGTSQGCAVGGAYRAAWTWQCAQGTEKEKMDFAPFVASAKSGRQVARGRADVKATDAVIVAEPSRALAKIYDEVLPSWRDREERVIEHCREA